MIMSWSSCGSHRKYIDHLHVHTHTLTRSHTHTHTAYITSWYTTSDIWIFNVRLCTLVNTSEVYGRKQLSYVYR